MPDSVIGGRYVLEDLLGRGGMSEVYCAHDQELGRRVALKLLAPDADRARFEREARAVASLAHPNVMQLYDYGEDGGRPYMVLEYVPGGTLEERLAAANGEPLPDAETAAIAAGVASGLAHAHARGVVHRDLKPANVLFDDEGRPKLADFGIARMAAGEGTLTEAGTVLGTAAYISPEQASGAPASAASDVYSFGVILYRMLTGRLPFESADPMELVMMNRDLPPPPVTTFRSDAPGRLEAAAAAALEKDPADRPADGAALLAALDVTGAGASTTAATALATGATQILPAAGAATAATTVRPGAAPDAAPPPPPRRSRMPLALAALLLLLIAGGALAYEMTRPSSSAPAQPKTHSLPRISLPKSTKSTSTTEPTTTTTQPPTSTQQTTTQPTTSTRRTTTQPTTTAAATTVPPPPTTVPPTTTVPTETTVTLTTTTGP
ncbi:MAG TPA: serine/threonine-protein kinase [Gaiellaceae bacterium]